MYLIMNNSCQSTGARRPDKGCKHYKSVILQCQEKQGLIKPNITFLMKKILGVLRRLISCPAYCACKQQVFLHAEPAHLLRFCHVYITVTGTKYYTR